MSKAHYIMPVGPSSDSEVVRLGASGDASGVLSMKDVWKLIKFSATDTYALAAAGDLFDGAITSVETATSGGWSIGGINRKDKMTVLADGLQATPGTGTIAAGDFVVCGTVTAKGTVLPSYVKVCKATIQPGDVPASLTAAAAQTLAAFKAWKVVSLGAAATGAVGTVITIERVNGPSGR